jgi:DNA-binding transcriptional ArsR family regulator
MSEIQSAIVKALEGNSGGISSLALRRKLPADMQGEGFDFALQALAGAGRVSSRIDDIFKVKIYRYVPEAADAAALPAARAGAANMARAVSSAFHPPPPALRVPLSGDPDEVKPPKPKSVSHAKRTENTMSTEEETDTPTRILELLAKKPMCTGDVARALDLSESNAALNLKKLRDKGKIAHQGNQRSPWALRDGKGAPEPVAAGGPGRAASTRKAKASRGAKKRRKAAPAARKAARKFVPAVGDTIQDVELKLKTLESLASNCPNRLEAFVLREIREDLQRLAA